MERRIDETVSALAWVSRKLREGGGMDQSECQGVAAILDGLHAGLENGGEV